VKQILSLEGWKLKSTLSPALLLDVVTVEIENHAKIRKMGHIKILYLKVVMMRGEHSCSSSIKTLASLSSYLILSKKKVVKRISSSKNKKSCFCRSNRKILKYQLKLAKQSSSG
jgi:hypothetical protein